MRRARGDTGAPIRGDREEVEMGEEAAPVGIVVVSHSGRVADSVVEMVANLAYLDPDGPALLPAGGLDDGSIGTDAVRIANAIGEADRGSGVVVVADLGSAVISAFTAIEELLEPDAAARVRVSGGPLVEGAFIGTVQAAAGDDLDAVLTATNGAAGLDKLEGRT
jgi:dihydroxyacetone kinase phosphotransfer subunit